VRLVHRPTEVTVTATERRSQAQNRSVALVRLRERLQALSYVPKRRVATKPTRGAKERRLEAKRHTSERKSGRRDLE
jgi:protein subunit release factor A